MFPDRKKINPQYPVIAWWSGGITSAVTCWLCIKWFGVENVRIIFIDTRNEDDDTYRFLRECQQWYGREIEIISNPDYSSIEEVWEKNLSLNLANGAICSDRLKRVVRNRFQAENNFSYQAFGFDMKEIDRAFAMKHNNPDARPFFPLIIEVLRKKDCVQIIAEQDDIFHPLTLPRTYYLGFLNNNCYKTGCVQGGVGYWQKMGVEDPAKFDAMAVREHRLTDLKGEPVTMLKDQGKDGGLVFLKPHPAYPHIKDISMLKGRPVKPLFECNGFCGTNDLKKNETQNEINYASQ